MRIFTFIYLCLLAFIRFGYATDIDDELKKLKKADNLIDWIDLRLNYTAANPQKNLGFLLGTQKQAWRKPKTENEHISWAYLLINQGYYQLYNGDILKSIDKYEEANSYYQSHNLPIDAEEYILKPLANNYTRIGDYERAIFIQQKSLDLALTEQTDTLIASIYNNLAISYRYKGDLNTALTQVKKGLQHCNQQNQIYGLLHSTSADILFEQQEYQQALKSAETAIKHLSNTKNTSYWLLGANTLAGNIYLFNNEPDKAGKYFDTAVNIINNRYGGSRKRELAHLLTLKSKLAVQKKDLGQALELANEAISVLTAFDKKQLYPDEKRLYAENKLQAALILKADILKQTGQTGNALKGYQTAFKVSEKLRKEYTYTSSKKQLQEAAKQLAEEIIETAYSLYKKTGKKEYAELILVTSEQTKARLLFDDLMFHQEKLAINNAVYANIIKIERAIAYYERQKKTGESANVDDKINELQFQLSTLKKKEKLKNFELNTGIKELLAKIPEATKAVVFFCGKKNIYIIDADRNSVNNIQQIANAAQHENNVKNFIEKYFYNGASAMMNNPKDFFNQSNAIYSSIFNNIDIASGKNLLIIKDGIYNYLSFDGLISNSSYSANIKKWQFMIIDKSIRYQYSLYQFNQNRENESNHLFSGFFLSNTQNNSVEIPSVRYEYEELRKTLSGNFYFNEKATSENFRNSLSKSNILHISSHAYLSDGTEPVLELYKDKFYLFELGSSSLPELVILNACQTADGKYVSGEGVESMGRGFLASGSKAVISGLWRVNDETGAKLLVSFYQQLLQHKNAYEALRQAKLNWINNPVNNSIMALPYYWDSLIYTGEDLEVSMEKKTFGIVFYIILSVIITIILSLMVFFYLSRKNI